MADSQQPKMPAETALVSVEEQQRLLDAQRLRTERKELRKAARMAELTALVSAVKLDSARIVDLRKHMFKEDEALDALGLTAQQKRIVRQFEEPKKATAFGVESAAKLIEAETRAQADKKAIRINVENMNVVQLPPKQAETATPLVIDVEVDGK